MALDKYCIENLLVIVHCKRSLNLSETLEEKHPF